MYILFFSLFGFQILCAKSEENNLCELNTYETSEDFKNFGKDFMYFLQKSLEKRSSEEGVREEKLFNTLISNINQGDFRKFTESFIKFFPNKEKDFQGSLSENILKFFKNYYKINIENQVFSGSNESTQKALESSLAYSKILIVLYRVALKQAYYSDRSLFDTSYILNAALKTLEDFSTPFPLLQYFLEIIFQKGDIRPLLKKIVSMSLTEYKDNEIFINQNIFAKQLSCIKLFQQASDQIQEEEDEKLLEGDAPIPLAGTVLEFLLLERVKKSTLSSGARKKFLRYLKKKTYAEGKSEGWKENERLIEKIIHLLETSSKKEYDREYYRRYDERDYYNSERYGTRAPNLMHGDRGSSGRGRVSLQGTGLLGVSAESVFRDASEEMPAKEGASKATINFWDRLYPKKSKLATFIKMTKKLKKDDQNLKKNAE
ncbi:hypothetical protein [Holospora obtusa]|nr:hypothetical protein [Holospora obtusa]